MVYSRTLVGCGEGQSDDRRAAVFISCLFKFKKEPRRTHDITKQYRAGGFEQGSHPSVPNQAIRAPSRCRL